MLAEVLCGSLWAVGLSMHYTVWRLERMHGVDGRSTIDALCHGATLALRVPPHDGVRLAEDLPEGVLVHPHRL